MTESDTHCIRRLRFRGQLANPRLARRRVEAALGDGAGTSRLGRETILCVRRLTVLVPRIEHLPEALEAEILGAVRPAHGFVPANANAVLFADRAELLACLARDWCTGNTNACWWWQALFPGHNLAEAVRQAWIGEPRHVPAALFRLHDANRSAEFLCALPLEVITTISINVARAFALEEVREAITRVSVKANRENSFGEIQPKLATRDMCQVTKSVADDETVRVAPWAEWVRVEPNLSSESEGLLVLSMMLTRAPTVLRSLKFLASVRDFTQPRAAFSRKTPLSIRRAKRHSASLPARSRSADFWIDRNIALPPVSDEVDEIKTGQPRIKSSAAKDQRQELSRLTQRDKGEVRHELSRLTQGEEAEVRHELSRLTLEDKGEAHHEAKTRASPLLAPPEQLLEFSCSTVWGGIFYLINVALALELYGDFTQPRRESSLPMPVWDFLSLIGARLVGPRFSDDAVWNLLATLSGRETNEPPGSWFDPPNESPRVDEEAASAYDESQPATLDGTPLDLWVNRVAHVVTKYLAHSLNESDPDALSELVFHHAAQILVTSERVTVCFSLAKHPIELRIAGLDRDPGWLPAAGRTVTFHYD